MLEVIVKSRKQGAESQKAESQKLGVGNREAKASLFHPHGHLPFRSGHLVPHRSQIFFQDLIVRVDA